MKKIFITLFLIALGSTTLLGQSKFSYTLQVNTSASLNDEVTIFVTGVNFGETFDLAQKWKPGITAVLNYQLNKRVRLQSGLGFNRFSLDKLNDKLNTKKYRLNFLSIPIKAHYFISLGKTKFYAGAGIRTDLKLNSRLKLDASAPVYDNSKKIGMSFEGLLGIEFPITQKFSINFEPTFSGAITSYGNEADFNIAAALSSFAPFFSEEMIDAKQTKLGFTFGLTYGL